MILGEKLTIIYNLEELSEKEREKYMEDYNVLFDSLIVWKFVGHSSGVIRKSVYRLIKTLLMQWKRKLDDIYYKWGN